MRVKRLMPYLLLAVIIAASFALTLALRLSGDWHWESEPVHSTVEALGALAAIIMGWVLLQRKDEENGGRYYLLALGFLMMGLLDGFHTLCPPGQAFVFFHSVSYLAGAVCFALVWAPQLGRYASRKMYTLWVTLGFALLFGLWPLLWAEKLPLMIHNGSFSTAAITINLLAGGLFLAAGVRFIFDFHRSHELQAYLFACLALLFGLAGPIFNFSVLWSGEWWLWHALRLAAYVLVLWVLARRYLETQHELRQHRDELEELVGERTADLTQSNLQLQHETAERKAAEETTKHLNAVLLGIRDVNELIIKEKDRDRLLQGACDSLVESRGYFSTWIALLDDSGRLHAAAGAGLGDEFQLLLQGLRRGTLTPCADVALKQPQVFVIDDRSRSCTGCPLLSTSSSTSALAVRLEHDGRVYGLMASCALPEAAGDPLEHALFEEVAGDIAFAVYSLEIEERRQQAEQELAVYRDELENLVEDRTKELTEANRITRAINQVLGEALTCESAADVAQTCLSVAQEMTGSRFGFIGEINDAGRLDTLALSNPGWQACTIPKSEAAVLISDMEPRGIWATVLKHEKSLIANDPPSHPDSVGIPEGHPPLTAFLGVPLKESGTTFGLIALANKEGGYGPNELEAVQALSATFSEALMRKRTEQSLNDARGELVRQERLAVLGQLSGGVGHELRNPLGVISNAVYYLKMVLTDADETTKEYLGIISSEVRNADKIVSDLLNLSRTKPAAREQVKVTDLVAQVFRKEPPPGNVEVAIEIPDDLPPVNVDGAQIHQVLHNLIRNAFQAMPEGGVLSIRATAERDSLEISVIDTGCGISKGDLIKVFEPLFTTKARGIGFGLTVCKNLVSVNGGSIEVHSQEGQGTTITVVLPLRETQP